MILPGIGTWTNRQEAIDPLVVGQAATHAQEVGIERSGPLVPLVQVATGGIGLPDLQQRVGQRRALLVKHAARHDDTLADSLAASASVARQVGVLRRDGADNRAGT